MSAEHAEIRRLEKELARAQMERDTLKKAIGIFSGPMISERRSQFV
jgi:transposase